MLREYTSFNCGARSASPQLSVGYCVPHFTQFSTHDKIGFTTNLSCYKSADSATQRST